MEASGGYERQAILLLWEIGLPCARRSMRATCVLRRGDGLLEKTDRIDAGVIAHYAEVKRVRPTPPPSPASSGSRLWFPGSRR